MVLTIKALQLTYSANSFPFTYIPSTRVMHSTGCLVTSSAVIATINPTDTSNITKYTAASAHDLTFDPIVAAQSSLNDMQDGF